MQESCFKTDITLPSKSWLKRQITQTQITQRGQWQEQALESTRTSHSKNSVSTVSQRLLQPLCAAQNHYTGFSMWHCTVCVRRFWPSDISIFPRCVVERLSLWSRLRTVQHVSVTYIQLEFINRFRPRELLQHFQIQPCHRLLSFRL